MNPDPDYSAAYVVIGTDAGDGLEGHGFAFTIGRGNDVQVAAIRALEPFVVGLPVEQTLASMGDVWRTLVHDSQLRWLGPEKGVMHMAISAVVNALWDLAAKRAGKPLWQLLAEMTPEELVELVDFRYLTDALTPDEALEILRRAEPGRAERDRAAARGRLPGLHDDARLARLLRREARAALRGGGRRRLHARSSSRSAPTSRTTSGGCGSRARSAGRTSGSPSTPTSAGTSATPMRWIRALAPYDAVVDRGADQPRRRARPRRHPARGARRSGSPPASTCRTASCSSS